MLAHRGTRKVRRYGCTVYYDNDTITDIHIFKCHACTYVYLYTLLTKNKTRDLNAKISRLKTHLSTGVKYLLI